jgi:Domain of unknown function (DUF4395)
MLRFDLPQVAANAARIDAVVVFVVSAAALLGWPYSLPLIAAQGLVRGFFRHGLEPMHRRVHALLAARGWVGKLTDAGPKMFANKVLFVAATAASTLWLADLPAWKVPVTALLLFSFLEWAFSFCAACWAYTAFYKLRGSN